MKHIFVAIPLVLLAACQAPGSPQKQTDNQCGAASWQNLVGTMASTLNQASLPEGTRILHPNTPMTRDYRLDRLNVYVDENGKITQVTCG